MRPFYLILLFIPIIGAGCQQESSSSPQTMLTGERAERLDSYFSALEFWGFSGVVLVADRNEVVLAKGYGMADRENGTPFNTGMVHTTGSITKQFTGAAILKLESDGKLSVEDRITEYFSDVPSEKSEITIHHLLTHSAGSPGAIGDDFAAVGRDDFVHQAMQEPLLFQPGEAYEYSNVGFSLLAAIIEQVSGHSYETYLREHLLLPAGAGGIGYLLPDWQDDQKVIGYRNGDRWGTVLERSWAEDGPYWNLRGNGGLHATAWDMYRWFQVVRGETDALPDSAVARWTAGYVDEGFGDSFYGYGWAIHDTPRGKMIAHNGGNMVFAADFFWLVEQDLFVYTASTSSYWRVPRLRQDILRVALDPEAPRPWSPEFPADDSVPEVTEGTYVTAVGHHVELETDGPRLRLRAMGPSAISMLGLKEPSDSIDPAAMNEQAVGVFEKLVAGADRPFDGVKVEPERAERSARGLTEFLTDEAQFLGPVMDVEVVGTIPGTNVGDIDWEVAATTWVVIHFEKGRRACGMLWDPEGSYLGTSIGPEEDLPSWIYTPVSEKRYVGWMPGSLGPAPELDVEAAEGGMCLVVGGERACVRP